jgi:hypothetical protein
VLRGQKTDDRWRMTDDRGQRADVRCHVSGVRFQAGFRVFTPDT